MPDLDKHIGGRVVWGEVMAERIAILTSTRALCKEIARPGHNPKRTIDARACVALAEKFDLVIVGSGASDKVYQHISQALPVHLGHKFRLYSRPDFLTLSKSTREFDEQAFNTGWMHILKENGVFFIPEREVVGEDYTTSFETFSGKNIRDFVVDERVTVITGRGQFMPAS